MAELNISEIIGERLKGWGTSIVGGLLSVPLLGGKNKAYYETQSDWKQADNTKIDFIKNRPQVYEMHDNIPDGKDLNDYIDAGVYPQWHGDRPKTAKNYPIDYQGILRVTVNSENKNSVLQEYISYNRITNTYSTYTRWRHGTNWTAWQNVNMETHVTKSSYCGGADNDKWVRVAWVDFGGNNQRVNLDFMMSHGYSNGDKPITGSITLQSGSDDTSDTFVTPIVVQFGNGIQNIHIFWGVDDTYKNVGVYIQLKSYSRFEITGVQKSQGVNVVNVLDDVPKSTVSTVDGRNYPANIKTL